MISRLPHSVLSLVFGLGPWITAGQGKAVPCQEIFTVCEQPYTEMELLEKYAPDILHWVSNEVEEQYQDYMVSIGFDEYRDGERKPMAEWVGHDNWEHADQLQFNGSPRERPRAVLYGGVVSVTKSQVYLVYYYFHPRDYVAGPLGKTLHVLGKLAFQSAFHENDLEGGLRGGGCWSWIGLTVRSYTPTPWHTTALMIVISLARDRALLIVPSSGLRRPAMEHICCGGTGPSRCRRIKRSLSATFRITALTALWGTRTTRGPKTTF